jgi:hypothetical protein
MRALFAFLESFEDARLIIARFKLQRQYAFN